jgi:hypothetical protein
MSFNPLMTLLARGLVDLVDEADPDVIELGNQTLNADARALRAVIERSRGHERIDLAGLETLAAQPVEARQARAAEYFRLLGFREYQAIDVNDRYGSLVMDLNKDLAEAYDYRRTFALVTNNGTGEHVFNQDTIFRNVHALTRAGGVMIHVMPFVQYVNHGFYSFHPNLYYALALANGYRLLAIGVGARTGHGILAVPPGSPERVPEMLLDERRVDLGMLLSEAKPPRSSLMDRLAFRLRPANEGRAFARHLEMLQRHKPGLLLFAILRKLEDRPFRTPIQTRYSGDIQDAALQREYTE